MTSPMPAGPVLLSSSLAAPSSSDRMASSSTCCAAVCEHCTHTPKQHTHQEGQESGRTGSVRVRIHNSPHRGLSEGGSDSGVTVRGEKM